jgi:hypothetical protein
MGGGGGGGGIRIRITIRIRRIHGLHKILCQIIHGRTEVNCEESQ